MIGVISHEYVLGNGDIIQKGYLLSANSTKPHVSSQVAHCTLFEKPHIVDDLYLRQVVHRFHLYLFYSSIQIKVVF